MGLQQFERRLERLVEGVFTKAFRSGLQPVEVGRRVTREMDLGRTVGVRGVIAPNAFTITLDPSDRERFASFEDALARELADAAREHARESNYLLIGPVTVDFDTSPLGGGAFRVWAEAREGPGGGPPGSVVLPDGQRVPVGDDALTIGRVDDCDVQVGDKNVSRRHAEIRRDNYGFVLVDLDSTNGTKVNGARIKHHELHDGDQITVGATTLRFENS